MNVLLPDINQTYDAHCECQALALTCLADFFPSALAGVIDRLAFGEPPLRAIGCHEMEGPAVSVELVTRDGTLALLTAFASPDDVRCIDIRTGLTLWQLECPSGIDQEAPFLELENGNFGVPDEDRMLCQFARTTGEFSRSQVAPLVEKFALFATVSGSSWIAIWLEDQDEAGTPCLVKPLERETPCHRIVSSGDQLRSLGFDYFWVGGIFFRVEPECVFRVTLVGGGSGDVGQFLDERTYAELQLRRWSQSLYLYESENETRCRFLLTRSVVFESVQSVIGGIFLERDPAGVTWRWSGGMSRFELAQQTTTNYVGHVNRLGDRSFFFDRKSACVKEVFSSSTGEIVKLPQGFGDFSLQCFGHTAVVKYSAVLAGTFRTNFFFLQ